VQSKRAVVRFRTKIFDVNDGIVSPAVEVVDSADAPVSGAFVELPRAMVVSPPARFKDQTFSTLPPHQLLSFVL
jgi:hypothetical protein